jgi:CO dehydrogenase maturation factor
VTISRTIAVAGKGGVGKTTLSALLVSRLAARGLAPVLAVDADPNACLDETLGVAAPVTVGALREDMDQARAMGMDKQRYMELKIAESLVEGPDFDLIAMGRPEGPGCYCYANNVLKDVLRRIAENYPYVVVDNEAGLENLSRRLLARVDALVLVGDPSARGLRTIERLHALAAEMGIGHERLGVVVNRVKPGIEPRGLDDLAGRLDATAVLALPEDDALARLDARGGDLRTLPQGNPLVAGTDRLLDALGFAPAS